MSPSNNPATSSGDELFRLKPAKAGSIGALLVGILMVAYGSYIYATTQDESSSRTYFVFAALGIGIFIQGIVQLWRTFIVIIYQDGIQSREFFIPREEILALRGVSHHPLFKYLMVKVSNPDLAETYRRLIREAVLNGSKYLPDEVPIYLLGSKEKPEAVADRISSLYDSNSTPKREES